MLDFMLVSLMRVIRRKEQKKVSESYVLLQKFYWLKIYNGKRQGSYVCPTFDLVGKFRLNVELYDYEV